MLEGAHDQTAQRQRIPWCGIAVFAVVAIPVVILLIRSRFSWLGWGIGVLCVAPILVPAVFFAGEAAVKSYLIGAATRRMLRTGELTRCQQCGAINGPETDYCVRCGHHRQDS